MEKKIDYERSFKKLVDQIRLETSWNNEQVEQHPFPDYPEFKEFRRTNEDFDNYMGKVTMAWRSRGARFAYESILELAEKLEKGEFF